MFKQLGLWWCPSWWKSGSVSGNSPFFKVLEYPLDEHRGFQPGNPYLQHAGNLSSALLTWANWVRE